MRAAGKLLVWLLWMLVVATGTFALGVMWFRPPTRQPLPFNHAKHHKAACVVCHRGVEAQAGLPDMNTCLNCHATPPFQSPAEVAIWNEAAQTKDVAWQRLTRVPEHVYFSHRRHVALGEIDCGVCHGDIGTRADPPPHALLPISMERCMDCHERERVNNDCARCHK